MNFVDLVFKTYETKAKIRLVLTDKIVCNSVYVVDCNNNDFEINVSDELIQEAKNKGRARICLLDYDEIESVELLDK